MNTRRRQHMRKHYLAILIVIGGIAGRTLAAQGIETISPGTRAKILLLSDTTRIGGFFSDRSILIGRVRELTADTLYVDLASGRARASLSRSAIARFEIAPGEPSRLGGTWSGLIRGAQFGALLVPVVALARRAADGRADDNTGLRSAAFVFGFAATVGAIQGFLTRAERWRRVDLQSVH
jgi:hypothetical protein